MALIECDKLTLAYDNRTVLTDLSFTVERGDCLCIVGENGTGKSTLIKALLGLKKPSRGTITFSSELQHRGIGYLPQKNEAQKDFPASVFEVVLSGRVGFLKGRPFYRASDRQMAEKQLEALGIQSLKKRSFADLSGGQQQRVLLARALCAAEELLLLDEPIAGLDPTAIAEFYSTLAAMKDEGMTILMVSHDLTASLRCATKVLWLRNDGYHLLTPAAFAAMLPDLLLGGNTHA